MHKQVFTYTSYRQIFPEQQLEQFCLNKNHQQYREDLRGSQNEL